MADIYSLFMDSIHNNAVSGCVIWDGDLDRNQQPVTEFLGTRTRVRDLIVKGKGGETKRGMTILPSCENVRCVRFDHFRIEQAEQPDKPEVAYSDEELGKVKIMLNDGLRQDVIAERLDTSRSRIAKMVRILKDQEVQSDES